MTFDIKNCFANVSAEISQTKKKEKHIHTENKFTHVSEFLVI